MAIEFPCAKCGQLVRTPDSAAGKKGKCPGCGQVQPIPGGEPTAPRPVAVKTPPAQSPPAPVPAKPAVQKPSASAPLLPASDAAKFSKPVESKLPRTPATSLPPEALPEPAPKAPAAEPPAAPNLPTRGPATTAGASKWTSYVNRGAESVRATPMPPADPRLSPRQPAEKIVLPKLSRLESEKSTEQPSEPAPDAHANTSAPAPPTVHSQPTADPSIEQRATDDTQRRRALLDQLTKPGASSASNLTPSASTTAPSGIAPVAKLEFACPSCRQIIRASAQTAGKKGRCPGCQAVVQIPSLAAMAGPTHAGTPTPVSSAAPPKPSANATPSPATASTSTAKLRPIGPVQYSPSGPTIPSLTPLSPLSGDMPLLTLLGEAAAEDNLPELTPLSPEAVAALVPPGYMLPDYVPQQVSAGLQPLGSVPFGDGVSALAALPATEGYLRPTSPSMYSSTGYAIPKQRKPSNRPGLPWERETTFGPLLQTAASVVFTPAVAFREMWPSGGIGHSIGYAALVSGSVAVISAMFAVVVMAALSGIAARSPDGNFTPLQLGGATSGILMVLVTRVAVNLAVATFQLTVSALITSGVTHGLMVLFGGARGGFGTTFRVFMYCMASTSFFQLLQFMPCCGLLITPLSILWMLIILMIGMTYAHEANGLASVGAVFIGVGVYYAVLVLILSMFFIGIIYAAVGPGVLN
jgi:predicted RNA-binding Zn-ribbon protein involved in translation (DUF1610 family)